MLNARPAHYAEPGESIHTYTHTHTCTNPCTLTHSDKTSF